MEAKRKPVARSENLIVERLDNEVLVYDKSLDRGHCLSNEAALVWDRCDGRTPAEGLSAQLGLNAEVVDRALAELQACELLEAPREPAVGSTRRELSVKLVKTGAAVAIAAPMIVSVVAPTPAHAVTLAFCRQFRDQGCGACSQADCCCCEPADGSIKDCVPDTATCCAIYGNDAVTSAGCDGVCPDAG